MENVNDNYIFIIHNWKPNKLKQWLDTDAYGEWWTADDKKGDKIMTNYEKYKEELTKIAMAGLNFAVIDGKPTNCLGAECSKCLFTNHALGNPCHSQRIAWLDKEYEEPKEELKTCGTCIHFHLAEGLENKGICDGYADIVYAITEIGCINTSDDRYCPKYETRGETND